MTEIKSIINAAIKKGRHTLSEFESTRILKYFGIPTAEAILAQDLVAVRAAAERIGYPVVLKACSPGVSHKTEDGLVAVDLRNEDDLAQAFNRIRNASIITSESFLVQQMIKGARELVMGMIRDPQFGPCVMFGIGGIFTEVFGDVTFRPAPLEEADAAEMLKEIKGHKILGAVRGMAAVETDVLIRCLMTLGKIGLEQENIAAIDVNPLVVKGSQPVAVDALVVLKGKR